MSVEDVLGAQNSILDDLVGGDVAAVKSEVAGLHAGKVNHAVHEVVKAIGLLLDHFAQFRSGVRRDGATQRTGRRFDRGERSTQVVRDGVKQSAFELFAAP